VSCNKFLTPPTVRADGTCPRCGNEVEKGLVPGMTRPYSEARTGVPWHLKLMLAAVALYLGYRFLQMGSWVIDWL
jgi:hypothetical protein